MRCKNYIIKEEPDPKIVKQKLWYLCTHLPEFVGWMVDNKEGRLSSWNDRNQELHVSPAEECCTEERVGFVLEPKWNLCEFARWLDSWETDVVGTAVSPAYRETLATEQTCLVLISKTLSKGDKKKLSINDS